MKKKLCVILLCSLCGFCNYGQSINYSEVISNYAPQNFDFKIAGRIGTHIHIWKFARRPHSKSDSRLPISILVYSEQMHLISERPVTMMDETVEGADENFSIEGDFYYAYIRYFTKDYVVKRQVLKVDETGMIISTAPYLDVPEKPGSFHVSDNISFVTNKNALVTNKSNAYFTTTEAMISDTNLIRERDAAESKGLTLKNIFIYRKYLADRNAFWQRRYSSTTFQFDNPILVFGNDNSIWVCASNKPDFEEKNGDSLLVYSLFLAKLDSNLHELPAGAKFLTLNKPDIPNKVFYTIHDGFLIDSNLVLIGLGEHPTNFYRDSRYMVVDAPGGRLAVPLREAIEGYEIKSFRILQLDGSGNCLMDCIISTNSVLGAKVKTDNTFCSLYGNEIDLLYQQQFTHKLNGIMYINIRKNSVKEEDVQVDPHNYYILAGSKRIDENTFVTPYTYKGKIGFMKWNHFVD